MVYRQDIKVFIVGPMARTEKGGVATSSTERIEKAVESLVTKHRLPGWTINAPEDLRGSEIRGDVFARIDAADLVIADVSRRSPNVYYELAYAHALGLPTIIVGTKSTRLPFYFKQTRWYVVPADDVETIARALEEPLMTFANPQADVVLSANPLSDFYQAPLVDVSAAAGLAIGYYRNFIYQLIRNDGVISKAVNRPVSGVLIVVPEELLNQRPARGELDRLVQDTVGRPVERDIVLERPKPERGFTVNMVGKLVIDLASAPYSLQHSPRVKRFFTARLISEVRDAHVVTMVGRLLDTFIGVLEDHRRTTPETAPGLCRIVRFSQAANVLQELAAKDWI